MQNKHMPRKRWKKIALILAIAMFLAMIVLGVLNKKTKVHILNYDNELKRTMTYDQFIDGDDKIETTDNVKFSSFFLRDLDGDGYAEKIKGTCKQVGSQDTLYMEIIVQTEGYLKDAKIDINGHNFYLQTAFPKDNELKENYIGNNIKTIEFEQLNNGTQKLLTGIVKSGDYSLDSRKCDAIGNNINNYSRNDNSIVLTGTYVKGDGTEIPITKEIYLTTDWYGRAEASIYSTSQNYYDIEDRIDEENESIMLSFTLKTEEKRRELNVSSSYVEATIPLLNGWDPISVNISGGMGDAIYDEDTRILKITKNANVDDSGVITQSIYRTSNYTIEVKYPLEAYTSLENDSISISIPTSSQYEAFNNPNQEFENPYKSNIAKTTVVANYSKPKGNVANLYITVGRLVSNPNMHYMISKKKPLKLYNEISSKEKDDFYTVRWEAYTGANGESNGLVLKETKNEEIQKTDTFIKNNSSEDSMEEITTNVGIYFTNAAAILGSEGEIKVYDEDTGELIHTFTARDWNNYFDYSPFRYKNSIKHIRIETSATKANSSLYIYNVKELDDDKIVDIYSKEEFENLQYIKSNLTMYLDEDYIGTKTHQAKYEEPYSLANISLSKKVLSTQFTEKNININISIEANEWLNQERWRNGAFLIKIPDEILDVKINEAIVNNLSVNLDSSEVIENSSGRFIKIKTSNTTPANYDISINVDLTPDPRSATITKDIELYAINEESEEYSYSNIDQYDVDEDSNTNEKVNFRTVSVSLIAPNSMITNQTISEFDNSGTIVISPKIAELKPVYGDEDLEKQTVKIGAQLKNNYSNTISEVFMLGMIPFEGNTYVVSDSNLNSEFSTTMINSGVIVPRELQGKVTVYYSENENPGKDLSNTSNGWTLKENVSDWTKIKTWAVDFGDTVLNKGDEYTFYYTVEVPFGEELNKVAYSHHGIYFSLDTAEGKYRTQTEPNKVGIRVADKYDLELTKYQKNVNKVIEGATYRVSKLDDQGNILETQTAKTNDLGQIRMTNLYAENVYEIKEIQTPEDYELNDDVIKIIGHVNTQTGELTIEKLEGTTKGDILVIKNRDKDYKAQVNVEDEARAKLKFIKYDQGTEIKLSGAKYNIMGYGLPDSGKTIKTNINGEANLAGLKVGEEYFLRETKAPEGYYLSNDSIRFRIDNNNGIYEVNILQGLTKSTSVIQENDLPVAQIEVEDKKIPTYDLVINKIEKGTGIDGIPAVPVVGAKFKLYKGYEEKGTFTTDGSGNILINGLYQYEESKNIDQTYTLKETFAPEGYAKTKDITFKAQVIDSTLTLITDNTLSYTVENNTINLKVEDSKSFKLVKKDGETNALLPNVKFAIYNEDEGEEPARNSKGEIIGTKETINGKEYYTLTTNSRGEITADLPEGIYRAVEVEADPKYDIEKQEQYFGIGESRAEKNILTPDYAVSIGGEHSDYIDTVAVTTDGGYIIGGRTEGESIQIGDYILTTREENMSDPFIVKYDANDEVEWISTFVGERNDSIKSISQTSDGGYIVSGLIYSNEIQIESYTLIRTGNDSSCRFIIKYNSDGAVEWANTFDSGSTIGDTTMVPVKEIEDGGYIYGGFFKGDIQIGTYTLINNGNEDVFIVKFDRNGEVEYASSFGGVSSERINSIAPTKDGGYIVGGYFKSENIQVGNHTLTNSGTYLEGFLIKYDRNNEVEWIKKIGDTYSSEEIKSVSETSDEGYIVGGIFNGSSVQIGEYSLTNTGDSEYDSFVAKYDRSGNVEWANAFGCTSTDKLISIAQAADGGYIAVGTFLGSNLVTEDYALVNNGENDIFIVKYNNKGEVECATSFGGTGTEEAKNISTTEAGGCIIVGNFYKHYVPNYNFQVGEHLFINKGSADAFLIKYIPKEIPEIKYKNVNSISGISSDSISSVAVTEDGSYIAVGGFNSPTLRLENDLLINKGSEDAYIVKYNNNGKIEWSTEIGGEYFDSIDSIAPTKDGGYVVGGYSNSNNIQIGDYTLTCNGDYDAFLVKYDRNNEVDYATCFKGFGGGTNENRISSVEATEDGGYIVSGNFSYLYLQIENYTLRNNGYSDAFLVKFNRNNEIEFALSMGGTKDDYISSVAVTDDGGYVIGGDFYSSNIEIGNYTLNNSTSTDYSDNFLIKLSRSGDVEFVNTVGGSSSESLSSVAVTKDGGYLTSGYFFSPEIQIGDYVLTNQGEFDSFLVKYNSNGSVEKAISIGGNRSDMISSMCATDDGGFVIGGSFMSSSIYIGNYTLTNKGDTNRSDCILAKYDKEMNVDWATSLGAIDSAGVETISPTKYSGYIVGVSYGSQNAKLGNHIITNRGSYDSLVININYSMGAKEQEEITFENMRKQYNITTAVQEVDGVKGGSVSGEDNSSYEIVKHGDASTKPIVMTPNENYEIIRITVNGEEYPFTALADGSYQMPQFENITEDKHVVVTYVLKDNRITINKVANTGEKISNIEFKLDQIEERTEPVSNEILGNLTENGITYFDVDTNNDVTNTTLGQLIDNGTYYFVEKEGTLVPTNSKTYQIENNLGTTGIRNSSAQSYMKIDLTNLQGYYYVIVNARASSERLDRGYATITKNTTAPSSTNSDGRFMYISETIPNEDYQSELLEGGNIYYLHIGYKKNAFQDVEEDQIVINSIKVCKASETEYNFITNNGIYESSNIGKDNTICNSYIPLDLTNYSGKYNITVNAEISTQSGDYGYVTINKDQTAPSHDNADGRIIYLTGIQAAKDYTYEIDGGYQYYLHLGYYKDGTTNTFGNDIFKVNSVNINLSDSELYHTSVTTNSEGQAITQIPFGKYSVAEINTPEGYKPLEEPVIIEFRGTDGAPHEFTIENEKKAKLIVHHYIKGTSEKLAEDEEYYGDIDEKYTTSPKMNIEGYSLEKDNDDEYILPTNATGQYRTEDTNVDYFYVPMPATVLVNHYIEGTETPVLLNNGEKAPREVKNGEPGNNYTTSAILPENLDSRYELVEVPENSTGTFTEEEIIVNYFYKLKSYKITTEVEEYDQTNILGDTEHIRGGNILGEKENPYEIVRHSENSKKDIIVTPDQGYEVQTLTINGNVQPFTAESDGKVLLNKFTNVTEDKHVVVRLGKKTSSVVVHHYIEGTDTRVPSKYGGEVQDQTTSGPVGNPYITNPTDELTPRYELVEMPSDASGLFTESPIEVIYYYREVPAKVIVNHYIKDTTNPVPLNNGGTASQETINGYVTKPYETNPLTNVSDQYVYVSDSGRTSGEMTREDIVVNYYYDAKAYAQINYIERKSDGTETTLETIDYQGLDGEEYTAHSKDFSGYYLIEKPNIETKNLNKDQITIFNYYYSKETGLLEKHINLYSEEILFNESHVKNYEEEYEIASKTFEGYDIATNKKYYEKQIKDNPNVLSENGVDSLEGLLNKLNLEPDDPYIPDNYKGTVGQDPIEVKYYYMKKAKVIVEYRDKLTDEPIHPDTPIDGHEKDPYKTNPEDIDGYDLIEDPDYTPTNTEGEMTPDTITVTYYYNQKAEVEINHIYIVDETVIENGKIEGHVKDLYKTNSLNSEQHPNYRLVTNKEYYDYVVEKDNTILSDNNVTTVGELLAKLKLSEYDPYIPENSKGEMTKENIIVNYYYKKQAKVIVKHIDEETGKELTDPEEEIKDLGDSYSAEPKTIEKYEVVKDKLPENAEGIVDEDGEEVIYYYRKAKKPIIPTANSGNTDEKQNKGEKVMSPQTGDTTLKVAIGMLIGLIMLNLLEKIHFNRGGSKPSNIIK